MIYTLWTIWSDHNNTKHRAFVCRMKHKVFWPGLNSAVQVAGTCFHCKFLFNKYCDMTPPVISGRPGHQTFRVYLLEMGILALFIHLENHTPSHLLSIWGHPTLIITKLYQPLADGSTVHSGRMWDIKL